MKLPTRKQVDVSMAVLSLIGAVARFKTTLQERREKLADYERHEMTAAILGEQDTEIRELRDQLNAVLTVTENLYEKVDTVMVANKANMEGWIGSVGETFESIGERHDEIGQTFESIKGAFDAVAEDIHTINENQIQLDANMVNLGEHTLRTVDFEAEHRKVAELMKTQAEVNELSKNEHALVLQQLKVLGDSVVEVREFVRIDSTPTSPRIVSQGRAVRDTPQA